MNKLEGNILVARPIVQRTRGGTHGPITRLMSPSDFGEILKPFVFLDIFDHEGDAPFSAGLHPHSGIATLSYIAEGSVSYIDPDNVRGTVPAGGVEWMQAGHGMWHGGGINAGRTRGFQLWIALPPELELGPSGSIYQAPEDVPEDGPARVLLGSYGSASSAIATSRRRVTPSSGAPSHPALCRFPTSCGAATWRLSSRRTKRSSSRRGP